jgi:type VI secretion system protein ImpA
MKRVIDIDAILASIPGDKPAGEDLRYSPVYDKIKEARKADDLLDQGVWKRKTKTSDWDKVLKISVEALVKKTKDLQIAAWLNEALIKTEGFDGIVKGFKILTGLLKDSWEHVYPQIEDGDLDFRVGPLEFLNDKVSPSIVQIPITESKTTPGYSWMKWQESRQVGYEKDTRNQYGDVDENKKKTRDEMISDGKLTAEDFDAAADLSSGVYYESLEEKLILCRETFKVFEEIVDERFGSNGPRLAEFRKALENLEQFISSEKIAKMIRKEKEKREIVRESEAQTENVDTLQQEEKEGVHEELYPSSPTTSAGPFLANKFSDSESLEKSMWEDSLKKLKIGGIKKALEQLYGASCSMPSVREKNRYRLLMAKLCLKAERPDLARPIAEELYALIEELQLERWESPMWIAEIHTALYQCLTAGTPSAEDTQRAEELFKKICTTDVTKAMIYNS